MSEVEPASQEGSSLGKLVGQHVGLVVTGLIFLYVVFRVVTVVNGDPTSALAVVSVSGALTVTLGVLVSSFGLFLLASLFVLELVRIGVWAPALRIGVWGAVVVAEVILVIFALIYVPISWLLVFASAYGLTRVDVRLSRARGTTDKLGVGIQVAAWPVILLVLALSGLSVAASQAFGMWLPAEVFETSDPVESYEVGYALSESDGWLTFLADDTRTVHRLRSEVVDARYFCDVGAGSRLFKSIMQNVNKSDVPTCPPADSSVTDPETDQGAP